MCIGTEIQSSRSFLWGGVTGLVVFFITALPSSAIENGQFAPDFTLTSYAGESFRLSDHRGRIIVLEWFNPGCPFVRHHYETGNIPRLQEELKTKGVLWVTINSTNPEHPDFISPQKAEGIVKELKLRSNYLLKDESGAVGKLYGAKTTPHMFVINGEGRLVYQGAIDDNSDVDSDVTKSKNYVRAAVEAVLGGTLVAEQKTPPYGCSVKYAS